MSSRDTKPLLDLTQPRHPVLSEAGRNVLQWLMFDPMITPVRASSRAYRTNGLDYERLHLEEVVSYLRQAPVSDDSSALLATQLHTVIARLELRKRLLGGLVTERNAAHVGETSFYEQERIRSRNWELLRQCAEKTGLLFEPLDLAGTAGQYAIVWFPLNGHLPTAGTSLGPVWKLLNIHDPWNDTRLKTWTGLTYTGASTSDDSLGTAAPGDHDLRLVPLGVYSLNYPKLPLLLIDFRDKLHLRWHEMTQRSINQITAGVIGISHFTNWYYYAGADLYDFVISRHGGAMDQAARLDSYSQFRVSLALDQGMNPQLQQEMQRRVDSLALNPLEATPAREMEAARARYHQLQAQADGILVSRLNRQRRAELAAFGKTTGGQVMQDALHTASLGLYTQRVKEDPANLKMLDRNRRLQYYLAFLDSLVDEATAPEVAYETSRLRTSVNEVTELMSDVRSPSVRSHLQAVLLRLKGLSQEEDLRAACSRALASLVPPGETLRASAAPGVLASPRPAVKPAGSLQARK